ncbi:MAG TPA: hypothetical protein VGQ99_08275 [Tepidisphaeraceae bacterium]|jgi:hypothetical protein|nr:hypothetical protein [Tepidisphaeraceae bacterium]
MAKGTKERRPTIGGFIPGEVEAHFDWEEVNDEETGKRQWVLTSKTTGEVFTIAHAYGDPLFWFELGLHAGENHPRRGTSGETGAQLKRQPPPKE